MWMPDPRAHRTAAAAATGPHEDERAPAPRPAEAAPRTVDTRGRRYELRFASLFQAGRALSFPCNAQGEVDEQGLNDRALGAYARAWSLVGREFAAPSVQVSDLH